MSMTKRELLALLKAIKRQPPKSSENLVNQWADNKEFREASNRLNRAASTRHRESQAPSVPVMPPC